MMEFLRCQAVKPTKNQIESLWFHPLNILEKQTSNATDGPCAVDYAPAVDGSWPILDRVPFMQDPQVQTWLELIDFTKTPVYPPMDNDTCPN
ncbi:hypothetical protein BGZ79_009956 [Entomortierella chlamydospora]|nr:hypothetical protein BGZ79_009956 [Entomortierella chlamydospora]